MERAQDQSRGQKAQRALERKRAADRQTRRVERLRTKEYIAQLEQRVQLLLQQDQNSAFIENILAENIELKQRVLAYQNVVRSATSVLQDLPEQPESKSEPVSAANDTISTSRIAVETVQGYSQTALPGPTSFTLADTGHVSEEGLNNEFEGWSQRLGSMDGGMGNDAEPPPHDHNFSNVSHILWNVGRRTLETVHQASPLDQMLVYRRSAGITNFHQTFLENDIDAGDPLADGKLNTCFGDMLPFLCPSLRNLFGEIRNHLSDLSPTTILADLSPMAISTMPSAYTCESQKTTDLVDLLKMSIAKDTCGTVLEAQGNLQPDKRSSPAEIIAVFWIAYKLFTWMAFPTKDNYSQIPPWYRPTQAQLSIGHPSYIDALVFPLLRDKLVYTHEIYETKKLLQDVSSLFTIVWEPKMWAISQEKPLIFISPENAWEFQLEPNFEAAIWDLRSWRMTPEFVALYPELSNCVHTY